MFRKRVTYYSHEVFLVLFTIRNVLAIRIVNEKSPSSKSRSFQTGLESVTGVMQFRMRSGSRKHKRKHEKRTRNRFIPRVTEMLGQPHHTEDTNLYQPDALDERMGGGQRLSQKKKKTMPRIYMTKVPIDKGRRH